MGRVKDLAIKQEEGLDYMYGGKDIDSIRQQLQDQTPVAIYRGTITKENIKEYADKFTTGVKKDAGKLRMDLLPPDVIEGWAEILTLGAEKYDDRNWELGMDWSRVYAAAVRHLMAFWSGEDLDLESGEPHIDHALCCISFLSAYQKRNIGKDDRNALHKTKP